MIALTPTAELQIDKLCQEHSCYAITLNVKGGGCAGFEYEWGTYTTAYELLDNDEIIYATEHSTFIVGAHSIMFLIGSTIDYKKDIIGSMFQIQNPNAQSSCGCGVSVNFDGII